MNVKKHKKMHIFWIHYSYHIFGMNESTFDRLPTNVITIFKKMLTCMRKKNMLDQNQMRFPNNQHYYKEWRRGNSWDTHWVRFRKYTTTKLRELTASAAIAAAAMAAVYSAASGHHWHWLLPRVALYYYCDAFFVLADVVIRPQWGFAILHQNN